MGKLGGKKGEKQPPPGGAPFVLSFPSTRRKLSSMKLATVLARVLLGLVFLVFGCNGFFHFIHLPTPTNPLAVQYFTALAITGYLSVVFALEIVAGVLLLAGFFVPLGLTILGPIIVNTLLFHGLMAPEGLPLPLVCALLEVFLLWRYWSSFAGIVRANA